MKTPVLLIIDVQTGLDDPAHGQRNNPGAESAMQRLLQRWREKKLPVVHVRHDSTEPQSKLRPELPGNRIKQEVEPLPAETLFAKSVNSAFIGTELEQYLRDNGFEQLVVVGLTTDHCISTSVRMAANLGFDVTLVGDATATFERRFRDGRQFSAEQMHDINLASLDGEFCKVVDAADVLAELS
ncbi:MAG: cysteine hydrolase [Gammaproteobacteria bacterium]|nr:cysteine hydrolase [Gammaproteobacteria bacterium]